MAIFLLDADVIISERGPLVRRGEQRLGEHVSVVIDKLEVGRFGVEGVKGVPVAEDCNGADLCGAGSKACDVAVIDEAGFCFGIQLAAHLGAGDRVREDNPLSRSRVAAPIIEGGEERLAGLLDGEDGCQSRRILHLVAFIKWGIDAPVVKTAGDKAKAAILS